VQASKGGSALWTRAGSCSTPLRIVARIQIRPVAMQPPRVRHELAA
jgi:hypothetical protein